MAESLNLMYSPEPSLQEGFLDKDTGLPLSFGLVYTYEDESRNVLKPLFTINEATSSSPVTYTPLPDPVVLSGIGTFQDANGNDVIPYFYPFDADGNVELYYIVVTNQYGVVQFTREAFPNPNTGGITPISSLLPTNFIANGQFLLHNGPTTPVAGFNYPEYAAFPYGIYTANIFYVAQGGWTFEVSSTSTSTYVITFPRATEYDATDSGSPRYSIQIDRTTDTSADTVCDLRIKFNDVFKFTSPSQFYTLLFNAKSISGTVSGVQVLVVDYYGTGGSPNATVEMPFPGSPIDITTTDMQFVLPIQFPLNPNAAVGTNDDDYVQIAIRFPAGVGTSFNVVLTDFMLLAGSVGATEFIPTTNGEFFDEASFATAPNNFAQQNLMPGDQTSYGYYANDGYGLYLPVVQTPQGMSYDFSQIGKIESFSHIDGFYYSSALHSLNNGTNLILCDGSSYVTSAYSPLGIPYARLQNVLFQSGPNVPLYGTGFNFVTIFLYNYDDTVMEITRNQAHTETATADGASPTGFSFAPVFTSTGSSIGITAYIPGTVTAGLAMIGTTIGAPVVYAVDGSAPTGFLIMQQQATPHTKQYFDIDVTTSFPPAGSFFQFGSTTTEYFMWFQVDGVPATPPVAGVGTPIICRVSSVYTNEDVAEAMRCSFNNQQTSNIQVTGTPPQSSYFTFYASGLKYNVWYNISNGGTAPVMPSGANIMVPITALSTNAQIAAATQLAINSYQFAVPLASGLFLRGVDGLGINDVEFTNRWSLTNGRLWTSSGVGTYQIQNVEQHIHNIAGGFVVDTGAALNIANSSTGGSLVAFTGYNSGSTDLSDVAQGYETRPGNIYVNFAIRY